MIIAHKFDIPDECPKNCPYILGIFTFGVDSICARCPVLLCSEDDETPKGELIQIMKPEDYRPDWAANWVRFFKALPKGGEEEC